MPSAQTIFQSPNMIRMRCIDEMQAATATKGWSVALRQLEAGQLAANMVDTKCGDISLQDMNVSRRIGITGGTPDAQVSVLAPVGPGVFTINGETFDGRGIFVVGPDTEFHSVNNEILRVQSMQIPLSLLHTVNRRVLKMQDFHMPARWTVLEHDNALACRTRSLMQEAIRNSTSVDQQEHQSVALATSIAAIFLDEEIVTKSSENLSISEAWRVVRCACEFIHSHVHEPISIPSICEYTAVSVSKLERAFSRELRMSPSQYILACRLNAVKTRLNATTRNDTQIINVALDNGFTHLGRFSGAYRAHFDELPSQTLNST